jgi:hypothetical protein
MEIKSLELRFVGQLRSASPKVWDARPHGVFRCYKNTSVTYENCRSLHYTSKLLRVGRGASDHGRQVML